MSSRQTRIQTLAARYPAFAQLRNKYFGVLGLKAFWLAAFTLAPLIIQLKVPALGLSLSLATILYVVYHGSGIYIWASVHHASSPQVQIEDDHDFQREYKLHKYLVEPLSMLVLALILITALSKCTIRYGGRTWRARIPAQVTHFLGVTRPLDLPSFDEIVRLGPSCHSLPGTSPMLECRVHVEENAERSDAYVQIVPDQDYRIENALRCGSSREGKYSITDCLLQNQQVHGLELKVSATPTTSESAASHAFLVLDTGSVQDELMMAYTLMAKRSFDLGDIYSQDVVRRANEQVASASLPDHIHIANYQVFSGYYYGAYTQYLRALECALEGQVEGRPCSDKDIQSWHGNAVNTITVNLRRIINGRAFGSRDSQQAARAKVDRLANELSLRFHPQGLDTTVVRRLENFADNHSCSDFIQQSRFFLALIALENEREQDARDYFLEILARKAPDGCEVTDSFSRILIAEAPHCQAEAGEILLRHDELVCAVLRDMGPTIVSSDHPAAATRDAHERSCDELVPSPGIQRLVKFLRMNIRKRLQNEPWGGDCLGTMALVDSGPS